jgi:hypothetical protein
MAIGAVVRVARDREADLVVAVGLGVRVGEVLADPEVREDLVDLAVREDPEVCRVVLEERHLPGMAAVRLLAAQALPVRLKLGFLRRAALNRAYYRGRKAGRPITG